MEITLGPSKAQARFNKRVVKNIIDVQINDTEVYISAIHTTKVNEYWTYGKIMSIVLNNKIGPHKQKRIKYEDQEYSILDGRMRIERDQNIVKDEVSITVDVKLIKL